MGCRFRVAVEGASVGLLISRGVTPHGLFVGTANPWGPRIMPLDGSGYVHNPRGGCEVYLAAHDPGP